MLEQLPVSPETFAFALLGAFCLGFSKAGFPGLALVNVVIMAELFGARASVGIILPLLILCDIAVYPLFARYASWREAGPLVGITALGVLAGYLILDQLGATATRRALGMVVLLMLALQILRQSRPGTLSHLAGSQAFRWWCGSLMGTATMIANAAAPAYAIYALVNRFTKEQFLGIGARCFLVINLFKAPLMLDLDLINRNSLTLDLWLIPGLALGIGIGRLAIQRIPQKLFEALLYLFSAVAGLRLTFF